MEEYQASRGCCLGPGIPLVTSGHVVASHLPCPRGAEQGNKVPALFRLQRPFQFCQPGQCFQNMGHGSRGPCVCARVRVCVCKSENPVVPHTLLQPSPFITACKSAGTHVTAISPNTAPYQDTCISKPQPRVSLLSPSYLVPRPLMGRKACGPRLSLYPCPSHSSRGQALDTLF